MVPSWRNSRIQRNCTTTWQSEARRGKTKVESTSTPGPGRDIWMWHWSVRCGHPALLLLFSVPCTLRAASRNQLSLADSGSPGHLTRPTRLIYQQQNRGSWRLHSLHSVCLLRLQGEKRAKESFNGFNQYLSECRPQPYRDTGEQMTSLLTQALLDFFQWSINKQFS